MLERDQLMRGEGTRETSAELARGASDEYFHPGSFCHTYVLADSPVDAIPIRASPVRAGPVRPSGRIAFRLPELTGRQGEALIEGFAKPGLDSHSAFDVHRVALLDPQARKIRILFPSEQGGSRARGRSE